MKSFIIVFNFSGAIVTTIVEAVNLFEAIAEIKEGVPTAQIINAVENK